MTATVRGVSDWLRVSLVLLLVVFLWGAQDAYGQVKLETPQQTNERIHLLAEAARAHPVDITVGAGDLLHIEVFDVPELNRDVRVTATGNIGFPLISKKIHAAGLTPSQLEEKLDQLLLENGLVSHPEVSVFVKEQNSQPVTVMGAVAHTMLYQVIRPTTLLELLAVAGGISDNAGSVVLITRRNRLEVTQIEPISTQEEPGPNTQTITVRLLDLLETTNNVFNVPIYGGDIVNIPPSGIVYALGTGVSQPGGYVLQTRGEQITVLKVLALAHGLASFAKKDDAVIYRVNPATGQRDTIPVHISKVEKNKEEDIAMKSNDILYVTQSGGKKAAAAVAQSAIQVGTAIAIYRVAGNNF